MQVSKCLEVIIFPSFCLSERNQAKNQSVRKQTVTPHNPKVECSNPFPETNQFSSYPPPCIAGYVMMCDV